MLKSRSKFLLHAQVRRTETESETFDDAQAGHPIERRLNRIERVAAAYRGQINLRFDSGMQVTFETPESALLAACEMQHRCAVLPQVSRQKLLLCIGIHQGVIRQRVKDGTDTAGEVARQLANVDDGILISSAAHDRLDRNQRLLARPFDATAGSTDYLIDWRRELPSEAYGGESFWPKAMQSMPSSPHLYLHFDQKTLEVSEDNPCVTIGREPSNTLVLNDAHVSRNHCRIERTSSDIVLTDLSTNGTTVVADNGEERLIKSDRVILTGRGLLLLGRPFRGERRGGIRFECF